MNFLRLQRQKLELILTFIIGIVWGLVLTKLIQRTYNPIFLKDSYATNNSAIYTKSTHGMISSHSTRNVESTISVQLYNEIRVLCMVLTVEQDESLASHIKKTWGKHCNKLIFISTWSNAELGVIKVPVNKTRTRFYDKTREGFRYVYEHYFNDADWFLKVNENTFVILENLRALLYSYSTNSAVYFGSKYSGSPQYVYQGYMNSDAGYVLSKEALRRFILKAYPNQTICNKNPNKLLEDIEMGRCLQNVGVVAGDSRDVQQLARFYPFSPLHQLTEQAGGKLYAQKLFYGIGGETDCCSDYAITFSRISKLEFYILDYLIYKLHAFGMKRKKYVLPEKLDMLPLIKKWRNAKSINELGKILAKNK